MTSLLVMLWVGLVAPAEALTAPVTPSPAAQATPAPDNKKPDAAAFPPGIVVAAQCATGVGLLACAAPLAIVCTTATVLGLPFVIAYFVAYVGNSLSDVRAAVLVPALLAYGAAAVGVAAAAGWWGAVALSWQPPAHLWPGVVGIGIGAFGVSVVAATAGYWLSAAPPSVDDDDGARPRVW